MIYCQNSERISVNDVCLYSLQRRENVSLMRNSLTHIPFWLIGKDPLYILLLRDATIKTYRYKLTPTE
uniref:Uncharacterized protein n=1 Tax=Lepeophtheirus salmonis TaxID=72036 RepID=A0A0K2U8D3_LEPSM